jgi:DNA-binding NarL/FixJ family response regulator
MEDKIRLIIVDDHEIFRQGLIMVSNNLENIEVVAEASNGKEFLEVLEKYKDEVDIVLMDIRMPIMDGIEATIKAKEKYPNLRIAAISMNTEGSSLKKMIDAGVSGFLTKNIKKAELDIALKLIMNDGVYYSKELMTEMIKLKEGKENETERLTDREIEVLQLVSQGLSNQEIADKLFISKRTVEGHKNLLLQKTGSKNTIDLLVYALNNEIIRMK